MSNKFGLQGIADKVNGLESRKEFNLLNIDIECITPSSKNLYGIRDIEELAADIKENGLYHNLVVRTLEDGKYEIISGERRYQALKKLGYLKAPCQVRNNLNDVDAEILLIQANAKSRELTHTEKMKQIERLDDLYKQKRSLGEKFEGKTRDLIGKDLGLSGVQVGRYQKIEKALIPELKQLMDENKLTMSKADIVASMDREEQLTVYELFKEDLNISRENIHKLKDSLKQQKEDFEKERGEYIVKLAAEAERMKNFYENLSNDKQADRTAISEQPEVKVDVKSIKFNLETGATIRNVKNSVQKLMIEQEFNIKNDKLSLSEENINLLRTLKEDQLKWLSEFFKRCSL